MSKNNYANLNQFRFRFRNKQNGTFSYFDQSVYGNIYKQIREYKDDLSKMCLIGVNNNTVDLVEVIHLFNNKTIYNGYSEVYNG